MLKYLIVLLDDTSVSFCHYACKRGDSKLIPLADLKAGLIWAMKENLMIQFVYPSVALPSEYVEAIDTVDHIDITPDTSMEWSDVVVFDGTASIHKLAETPANNPVLRLDKDDLFSHVDELVGLVKNGKSCRVVIKDVINFNETDFITYKSALGKLSQAAKECIISGNGVQINLITDRIQLDSMNNCNAGVESVTLAPDGKFYICPAFYYDGLEDVGNPTDGLDIPNQQLYRLDYAPICRNCDAYHCKRCVWLNQKTTLEVNTPSHEQCVVSHLERNESMHLLNALKLKGKIGAHVSISEIDYLDPYDKIVK